MRKEKYLKDFFINKEIRKNWANWPSVGSPYSIGPFSVVFSFKNYSDYLSIRYSDSTLRIEVKDSKEGAEIEVHIDKEPEEILTGSIEREEIKIRKALPEKEIGRTIEIIRVMEDETHRILDE